MTTQAHEQHDHNEGKHTLNIGIQAPRVRDPQFFNFSAQTKIADVIRTAVADPRLKLAPNGNYTLTNPKPHPVALQPERTLASYGLKDHDVLVITADGSGV